MQRALIIFAKQPAAGQTKTRLAGQLGPEGAAELYRHLLLDTIAMARRVRDVRLAVAYAPEEAAPFFRALLPEALLFPQRGGDLGERMDGALCAMLDAGHRAVALIGGDIPLLSAEMVEQAFVKLDEGAEAVFGPSEDGGYYLIGVTRPQPHLLRSIVYSTPSVLYETLLRAAPMGVRFALLPATYDIDTPDDLQRLREEIAGAPADIAPETRAFLERMEAAR
jgi:uncharacterized protein